MERKDFEKKVLSWLKSNGVQFTRFPTIQSKKYGLEARVFFGGGLYVDINPAQFNDPFIIKGILENELS